MAASFLPGHDDLFEIFNDSRSEEEFEDFDPEDQEENVVQPQISSLLIENWVEGDREPTALPLTATPGLTANATLPDEPQLIDYFSLFFHQTDLEKITEETNHYEFFPPYPMFFGAVCGKTQPGCVHLSVPTQCRFFYVKEVWESV